MTGTSRDVGKADGIDLRGDRLLVARPLDGAVQQLQKFGLHLKRLDVRGRDAIQGRLPDALELFKRQRGAEAQAEKLERGHSDLKMGHRPVAAKTRVQAPTNGRRRGMSTT